MFTAPSCRAIVLTKAEVPWYDGGLKSNTILLGNERNKIIQSFSQQEGENIYHINNYLKLMY